MTPDAQKLDDLFAVARTRHAGVPAGLAERVLADAFAEMPSEAAVQIVNRASPRGRMLGLGWLQLGSLCAIGAAGVVLGFSNPVISDDFSAESYSLSDLMPGLQDVLEEGEG